MGWLDIVSWIFGAVGAVVAAYQAWKWYWEWREERIDSFASIERHGIVLLQQIKASGFQPEFVLGLGRSGAFLAGWLAGNLGSVRIEVFDRVHKDDPGDPMEFPQTQEKMELWKRAFGERAKVLVVEGAATRGGTFYQFERIRRSLAPEWQCRFCALYQVDTVNVNLAYYVKKLSRAPKKYPWHKTHEWRDFIRVPTRLNLV